MSHFVPRARLNEEHGAAAPAPPRPVPGLRSEEELRRFRAPRAKRVLDVVGAVLILVATAPLTVLIAIAIGLDSPGPIIYCQERVGINRRRNARRSSRASVAADARRRDRRQVHAEGRPFEIVKFRTMVAHAERDVGPTWAMQDDPRITRVGRILRATRLDELPQLWNVLAGDMSLVGPRPERPFFVNRFAKHIPQYRSRLYAPPGITGLAQVEHRYDSSEDDVRRKLHYDLAYMGRSGLREDLRILARTVLVMIARRGAN